MLRNLRQLGSSLIQLAASWWHVDRIRSASSEGRLLRLSPGSFLCIDGRRAEVVGRNVESNEYRSTVVYALQFDTEAEVEDNGCSRLTVCCDRQAQRPTLELHERNTTVDVYESEITVFG